MAELEVIVGISKSYVDHYAFHCVLSRCNDNHSPTISSLASCLTTYICTYLTFILLLVYKFSHLQDVNLLCAYH